MLRSYLDYTADIQSLRVSVDSPFPKEGIPETTLKLFRRLETQFGVVYLLPDLRSKKRIVGCEYMGRDAHHMRMEGFTEEQVLEHGKLLSNTTTDMELLGIALSQHIK